MEKKISMNDVVAFVKKAMENNMELALSDCFSEIIIYFPNYNVNIWKSSKDHLSIHIGKLYPYIIDNLSDLDCATFEYLCATVKEYSQNKTLEYFNNLFKDEESKFKDINDLDDKED